MQVERDRHALVGGEGLEGDAQRDHARIERRPVVDHIGRDLGRPAEETPEGW